jgi:perosamine synthetase
LNSEDFENAYIADQCSISLPLFHGMKKEEQDFVIDQVLKYQP